MKNKHNKHVYVVGIFVLASVSSLYPTVAVVRPKPVKPQGPVSPTGPMTRVAEQVVRR